MYGMVHSASARTTTAIQNQRPSASSLISSSPFRERLYRYQALAGTRIDLHQLGSEADMSIEEIGLAIIVLVGAMAVATCIVAVLGDRAKTILLLTLLVVMAVAGFVIQMRGG